jgi:hypothetical protein
MQLSHRGRVRPMARVLTMMSKTQLPSPAELSSPDRLVDYFVALFLAAVAREIRRRNVSPGGPKPSA